MTTPIPFACPKCAGEMTTHERAGVPSSRKRSFLGELFEGFGD